MPARLLGFCCLLFGLAAWFLPPAYAAEPRVALVIGNSGYGPNIGKLKNPVNDAKLMADTLQGLGFSVDLVLDADQKAMKRAVKSFGAKLRDAGSEATGLFYYAGHGVQVEGENFLLPVGAEIEAEADVEIESIAAADVMTQMESAGNRVNLVFLDACRNNPLAKASRSGARGLARLDAPRGSFVGYSTAPGDVAADGDGANSPYALALAEELKKPGLSIDEAHRNVRAKVLAETGNKQTPWDSSSLTGAVVLLEQPVAPAPAPVAAAVPAPQPAQQAAIDKEVVFWESIKDSTDPAEYEAYLQQYPDGSFAPLAKAKIAKLAKAPAAPPAPTQPAQPVQQASIAQDPVAPAAKLSASPEALKEIDTYLENAAATSRYWALAITNDGRQTSKVSCPKTGLSGKAGCYEGVSITSQNKTNQLALKTCGADCTLLYAGKDKVAAIELANRSAGTAASSGEPASTPAASSQAPANSDTIIVDASVKEQIDTHLANCRANHGFVCYLFVSRAGDAIGFKKVDASWMYAHEQARRDAERACGGPTECVPIMDEKGERLGLEIVAR
jgi:carboxyl-terminal processing protease